MAHFSPFKDYQVGGILTLSAVSEQGGSDPSPICARIRQLHTPRTLSCCMIVELLSEDGTEDVAFLKLYDRRFSEQLRRDHGVEEWTRDAESEHIEAVRSGAALRFLLDLNSIPDFERDTEETWDDGQIETFLTDQAYRLFGAETKAYDALRDIQGKMIPRLVARVHLSLAAPGPGGSCGDAAGLPDVKGVLLQYIDGFPLSKVQLHAPRSEWQGIVDQAVAVVQAVGDRDVLNRDVRPDNFVVVHDADSGSYGVFMIDFGLSRLRARGESNRDWARAKLEKDEEGAVGLVMKKRLSKEGFDLQFKISDRFMDWFRGNDE